MISRQQLAQLGLGLGGVLFPELQPAAQALGAGMQLLFLRYGRDAERQADQLGFRYARADGYDASEMADVFAALGRASALEGQSPLPSWLSSHPAPADRIQAAQEMVAAAGPPPGVELVDARSVPFDLLDAYDRRHFGARRAGFLASWITLPGRWAAVALRDRTIVGFGVLRPAQSTARIGPLFAESRVTAEALVSRLASSARASAVAVDVPGVNPVAVEWARGCGWTPSFDTTRMYTGAAPAFDHGEVFGITTLELG